MNNFKKWNLIAGWLAFAVAAVVYIMTTEPTTSLWDCAEFIATSYKLEVGHPPGAPLFMMIARFFTIFAPSPDKAALMVNIMSCLCGAFTVLFLFWSITHLGRKIYAKDGKELSRGQMLTVLGAGLIGALAYCFTDTQWFSAVEGEVYSMSSMFTAMVFWMMLQWENVADKPHSNRWLILIAYMMGLSIGIHILNLLTIPALVFIYYFKKYPKVTKWGVVAAILLSGALVIAINYILVPKTVAIGAFVDRLLVNGIGLPINTGLVLTTIGLFVLAGWAVWYTHKKGRVLANTIILCASVIMLGYSSYASVVIRANANPPMNSNNPNTPYALLSLLNRDQYGNRPLLYGPYYSSPVIDVKEGSTYFINDKGEYEAGKFIADYKYPDQFQYLFPRMYSQKDSHVRAYKAWGHVEGRNMMYDGEMITGIPTFGENMRYFFSYQLNFMYWRYFLWNFVGRQSDIQSTGEITDGNWLSGIDFIDELYLGPQDDLPSEMASNRGRNTYFFLPFILGLIGLLYQLNKDKRDFTVVMWMFLMTGIVLVLYFNTTPGEPRERDYVYAGSFYAFCVWIGLGVMCIRDLLTRLAKSDNVAIAAGTVVVCSCVPLILAAQNWDDHDRSNRYVARDIGWNYLQSALPNAIVMNYGDNDTFPLWYNQEVEGVRTDVKVMNMSYLGADWYIDQMRIRSNESEPVPFSLPRHKYVNTNDMVIVEELFKEPKDIKQVMDFVRSDDPRTKAQTRIRDIDVIPTRHLALPVNKANAIASGIVKERDAHLMVDTVYITIGKSNIDKSELMMLDLLANFDWKRPLHFTQAYSLRDFGLLDYLQYDGYTYRLVPIKTPARGYSIGRVDTETFYTNLMEKFRYGNVADPRVYCDSFIRHNFQVAQASSSYARLAKELLAEGDTVRAVKVLDYGLEVLPFKQIGYSHTQVAPAIEAYYAAGEYDKGNALFNEFINLCKEYVVYYAGFDGRFGELVSGRLNDYVLTMDDMLKLAAAYRQTEQIAAIQSFYKLYGLDE